MDTPCDSCRLQVWQDDFSKDAGILPQISFSDIRLQTRWKTLIGAGEWEV